MTERVFRTESSDTTRGERAWSTIRVTLGVLQMTAAALALGLLQPGRVTALALTVVVLTCLLTTISVVLFGSHPVRCDTIGHQASDGVTSAPSGRTAVAVLACVIAIAAAAGGAVLLAVWLIGTVHGLVLTHGAAAVFLAATGGIVGISTMIVFGIMLTDLLRK